VPHTSKSPAFLRPVRPIAHAARSASTGWSSGTLQANGQVLTKKFITAPSDGSTSDAEAGKAFANFK